AALPQVPTVAESGIPGYEVSAWFALFAPAGTPPATISRLNTEVVRAMKLPDVRERLASQGAEPLTSSPEDTGAYVKSELAKWSRVVKASGMKLD
ncbi:MAG: tripartite tricarboxylate transporter substrate-binding protein, partial [Burkholderiales bacterium]